MEVGLVQTALTEAQRRAAYAADVTYVTNSELGFDYLRDNLAQVGVGACVRACPRVRRACARRRARQLRATPPRHTPPIRHSTPPRHSPPTRYTPPPHPPPARPTHPPPPPCARRA